MIPAGRYLPLAVFFSDFSRSVPFFTTLLLSFPFLSSHSAFTLPFTFSLIFGLGYHRVLRTCYANSLSRLLSHGSCLRNYFSPLQFSCSAPCVILDTCFNSGLFYSFSISHYLGLSLLGFATLLPTTSTRLLHFSGSLLVFVSFILSLSSFCCGSLCLASKTSHAVIPSRSIFFFVRVLLLLTPFALAQYYALASMWWH